MRIFYSGLLALVLVVTGCQPQESGQVSDSMPLKLRYQVSAEAMFTDIRVENGVLAYTFFTDKDNRCAQWFKSTPCWTTDDLETVTRDLEVVELEKLWGLVNSSGVLVLKGDTFGETNLRKRAYTETLTVNVDGAERVLRYRSTPEAEEKPGAFILLEGVLRDYANKLLSGKKWCRAVCSHPMASLSRNVL